MDAGAVLGARRMLAGLLAIVCVVALAFVVRASDGATAPVADRSAPGAPAATDAEPDGVGADDESDAVADRCAAAPDAERRIVVDLSDQRLWLCVGRRQLLTSPVTTGKDATPTPPGRWFVHGRMEDKVIQGEGYRRHVDHWMPYFQGYGFHDARWQRFPFGDDEARRTRGSHGCVRVPGPVMAELYDRSPLGTAVRITR